MKIPLFKAKSLGFERTFISFFLKCGSLPSLILRAIVDTGCPFTIISQDSLKRSRISYGSGKLMQTPVQIGPIKLNLKSLGECKLLFRDTENKLVGFKHNVHAGIPIIAGKLTHELPCFIGNDFLEKHSLSIIHSKDGKIYLTQIE